MRSYHPLDWRTGIAVAASGPLIVFRVIHFSLEPVGTPLSSSYISSFGALVDRAASPRELLAGCAGPFHSSRRSRRALDWSGFLSSGSFQTFTGDVARRFWRPACSPFISRSALGSFLFQVASPRSVMDCSWLLIFLDRVVLLGHRRTLASSENANVKSKLDAHGQDRPNLRDG